MGPKIVLALLLIFPLKSFGFSVGDIPCTFDILVKHDVAAGKVVAKWPKCGSSTEETCGVLDTSQASTLPTTFTNIWTIAQTMPPLTAEDRVLCEFPVNVPPTALDAAYTIDKNVELNSSFQATDPDSNFITFDLITGAQNGSIQWLPETSELFTYTPVQDFVGTDSFTFQATDSWDLSNIATISITVNDVIPPPPTEWFPPTSNFDSNTGVGPYDNPDNAHSDDTQFSNVNWFDGDWAWTGFNIPTAGTSVVVEIRGYDTYGDGGNRTLVSISNDGVNWSATQTTPDWTATPTTASLTFPTTDVTNLSVRLRYQGDGYANEQAIEYIQVKVNP